MKKITVFILLSFLFINLFAQNKENIIVSYDVKEWNYAKDAVVNQKMSLIFNKDMSKYYNEISQWTDSLSSTPEGAVELKEIIMAHCMTTMPDGSVRVDYTKGPVKDIFTYVINKDGDLTTYGKWGTEQRYYQEPNEEINWTIEDTTKDILGYECIKAETDYHGRHWTAWFTPEIPVAYGPWKLRGLPGLILSASTGEGFEFSATGIQYTDRMITPVFQTDKYSKTDRKRALSDEEYYQNNKQAIISAKYGGNVKFTPGFQEDRKYDGKKYSLEPDYKE